MPEFRRLRPTRVLLQIRRQHDARRFRVTVARRLSIGSETFVDVINVEPARRELPTDELRELRLRTLDARQEKGESYDNARHAALLQHRFGRIEQLIFFLVMDRVERDNEIDLRIEKRDSGPALTDIERDELHGYFVRVANALAIDDFLLSALLGLMMPFLAAVSIDL